MTCSFDPEQGMEFVRRLFEDRHSAQRQVTQIYWGSNANSSSEFTEPPW